MYTGIKSDYHGLLAAALDAPLPKKKPLLHNMPITTIENKKETLLFCDDARLIQRENPIAKKNIQVFNILKWFSGEAADSVYCHSAACNSTTLSEKDHTTNIESPTTLSPVIN